MYYLKQLAKYQRQGLEMRWSLSTVEQVDTGQAKVSCVRSVGFMQGCRFREALSDF